MSETLTENQGAAASLEVSDFEKLLNAEFKPKSAEADSAVKDAVQTLVQQALSNANLISDNAIKTIEGMIAELDKKLSAQVNEIIHHPNFEQLESAWRGLSIPIRRNSVWARLSALRHFPQQCARFLHKKRLYPLPAPQVFS